MTKPETLIIYCDCLNGDACLNGRGRSPLLNAGDLRHPRDRCRVMLTRQGWENVADNAKIMWPSADDTTPKEIA